MDPLASSPPVDRRNVLNAVHLGASFCMIFMSFSVSQSFQTSSDHKSQGSTALGILYACFTFSNFFSSFIVSTIGSKLSLILGSLTYVAFVGANIHYTEPTLYLFSGTLGVGAAVLWTAQGAYISNCAALHERAHGLAIGSTLGFFNGTFWSLFQMNMIIGSLLAALLFKENVDVSTIFVVMTAICGVGALTLTLLKDPAKALPITARGGYAATSNQSPDSGLMHHAAAPSEVSEPSYSNYPSDSTSQLQTPFRRFLSVFESLKLLAHTRMLVLVPLMIYSGLSQTYIFGDFPPLVIDRSTKYFVIATLGAADAASSMLMGKLSDKHGRVVVLAIGFVTALSSILFLSLWTADQSALYVFFLAASVLGISDGVFNTQIYAILGSWYEGRAEQAFATFKLFQAGSTAVAFLVDNELGFQWKSWITAGMLVVGYLVLMGYDLSVRKGGVSVLDTAGDQEDGGAQQSPDGVTSPMLHSDYGSPQLHGHPSVNGNGRHNSSGGGKSRADSLHLESTQYRPVDL